MFTTEDAAAALAAAGVDISEERYGLEDVRDGMSVELEHGTRFPNLDVSGDDPVTTVKIALAHLREIPDYYERLEIMEREGKAAWEGEVLGGSQDEQALVEGAEGVQDAITVSAIVRKVMPE